MRSLMAPRVCTLVLSSFKEDVKYFTEVEKRMKSLERQRLALIVIVFIIVPLVVAHIAHVFLRVV